MRRPLVLATALAIATVVVFRGALDGEFVDWDDGINVSANPNLNPATARSVLRLWSEPYLRLYIPLTYTAWAAITPFARGSGDRGGRGADGGARGAVGPLDPRAFHAANLAAHVASVLLVFGILRLVVRRDGAALCGALVFALHPAQVEPVSWVTGMKDVLGGGLALAAIWFYLRRAADSAGRRRRFGTATALFVLALLAKPSAVAAPLVAWSLDRWALGRSARAATTSLAAWGAIALAWVALTAAVQPRAALDVVASAWGRVVVAGDALAFYARHVLWPAALAVDYGRSPAAVLAHPGAAWALALPAAVGALAWIARRRAPSFVAAAAVFACGLAPVLGFIPFEFQNHSTVADRYLYVALLGPALGVAAALRRPRLAAIVAAAIGVAALLGARSAAQVRVWKDTETLFAHALEVNPRSAVAHNLYGLALARAGRADDALAHYAEAIRLRPAYAEAHYHRGLALLGLGRAAEAEAAFAEAIRRRPEFVDAHNNLGVALARQERRAEAAAAFERALALRPDDPEAHTNLGNALAREGRPAEARAHYERALAARPDSPEALGNLGALLAREGDAAGAVDCLERAVRLRPESSALRANLGLLLLSLGRNDEAIAHLSEAVRLDAGSWEAQMHLARALAAAGRADEARAAHDAARRLNPALPESGPGEGESTPRAADSTR